MFDPFLCNYPLCMHNTLGFSVSAHRATWLTDETSLPSILNDVRIAKLPYLLLGYGSNIVLTRDFPGLVIFNRLKGRRVIDENKEAWFIEVAAGENWHDFVVYTLIEGKPGLENLACIPGSVGAAPVQNIGAYGVEVANFLYSVQVFDMLDRSWRTLYRDDCKFSYRDSIFKHIKRDRWIITSVIFRLPKKWEAVVTYKDVASFLDSIPHKPSAYDVFKAVSIIRRNKLPDWRKTGNAGSFFKNPLVDRMQYTLLKKKEPKLVAYSQSSGNARLSAGWMIEQCGFKGMIRGRVGVHHAQALVLVNLGGGTGNEIVALASDIINTVATRFGVVLEIEPLII